MHRFAVKKESNVIGGSRKIKLGKKKRKRPRERWPGDSVENSQDKRLYWGPMSIGKTMALWGRKVRGGEENY